MSRLCRKIRRINIKLIYCPKCQDVRKLNYVLTTCQCGRSFGRVLGDGLDAQYGGDAVPLGFDNSSLVKALKHQPDDGWGERFEAFVIPKQCDTCKKIKSTRIGE